MMTPLAIFRYLFQKKSGCHGVEVEMEEREAVKERLKEQLKLVQDRNAAKVVTDESVNKWGREKFLAWLNTLLLLITDEVAKESIRRELKFKSDLVDHIDRLNLSKHGKSKEVHHFAKKCNISKEEDREAARVALLDASKTVLDFEEFLNLFRQRNKKSQTWKDFLFDFGFNDDVYEEMSLNREMAKQVFDKLKDLARPKRSSAALYFHDVVGAPRRTPEASKSLLKLGSACRKRVKGAKRLFFRSIRKTCERKSDSTFEEVLSKLVDEAEFLLYVENISLFCKTVGALSKFGNLLRKICERIKTSPELKVVFVCNRTKANEKFLRKVVLYAFVLVKQFFEIDDNVFPDSNVNFFCLGEIAPKRYVCTNSECALVDIEKHLIFRNGTNDSHSLDICEEPELRKLFAQKTFTEYFGLREWDKINGFERLREISCTNTYLFDAGHSALQNGKIMQFAIAMEEINSKAKEKLKSLAAQVFSKK